MREQNADSTFNDILSSAVIPKEYLPVVDVSSKKDNKLAISDCDGNVISRSSTSTQIKEWSTRSSDLVDILDSISIPEGIMLPEVYDSLESKRNKNTAEQETAPDSTLDSVLEGCSKWHELARLAESNSSVQQKVSSSSEVSMDSDKSLQDIKKDQLIHGLVVLNDIQFLGYDSKSSELYEQFYDTTGDNTPTKIENFYLLDEKVDFKPNTLMSIGAIWSVYDELPKEIFEYEHPIIAEIYAPASDFTDDKVLLRLAISSVRTLAFVSVMKDSHVVVLSNFKGDQCLLCMDKYAADKPIDKEAINAILQQHSSKWVYIQQKLNSVIHYTHGDLIWFAKTLYWRESPYLFFSNFSESLEDLRQNEGFLPLTVKKFPGMRFNGVDFNAHQESAVNLTYLEIWDVTETEELAKTQVEHSTIQHYYDSIMNTEEILDYVFRDSAVVVKVLRDKESDKENSEESESSEKLFITCALLREQFDSFTLEEAKLRNPTAEELTYICMSTVEGENFRVYQYDKPVNILERLSTKDFQKLLKAHYSKLEKYLRLKYTYSPEIALSYANNSEQTRLSNTVNIAMQKTDSAWKQLKD